jgi:hypothetical protein
VTHPDAAPDQAGVFHFRRTINFTGKPLHFPVRVSADNRYRLFVNGVPVARGPARGDVMHWRYETVDIAPHLRAGTNVLAATVWNWGEHRPLAQMSYRTGFLLQGDGPAEAVLNTGPGWQVLWNRSYSFTPVKWPDSGGYYVAAPGEVVDARLYPWDWQAVAAAPAGWQDAKGIVLRADAARGALPRGAHNYGEGSEWQLVPRNIPPMEERPVRFARIARAEGVRPSVNFLRGAADLIVPANSRASVLFDQAELTFAYPTLVASGGRDAIATLTYSEAMFDGEGNKGNRNEINGKAIRGVRDKIIFDGGSRRTFEMLWPRTYRYVQMDIETAGEPLRLHELRGIFTAYPFEQRASFSSNLPWIAPIWDMNWRVFRLSAFETFWDTPYYEQLQYIGDTRIESLISLYNSGDDRLMRNAIEQFDHSRIPEGITASRYPSSIAQYIPPFSLWWAAMVHDYWMHRDDIAFIRRFIPGVRGVLSWYERHLDDTGMLGPMPWWNFLDWNSAYQRGVPPGAEDGNSTPLTLQFVYALQRAAELEDALAQPAEGARYRALSEQTIAAVRARAWDPQRGLFGETPEKKTFSQQTNALAVLVGAVPPSEQKALMRRVLEDQDLIQASFYFRFYIDEALRQAGLADRYVARLEPWREMIRMGLTTTPETPEPTRSDSHAWSAHPNYHLLATVLGVRPDSPGFQTVRISPALGAMRRVSAVVPHPKGSIVVRLNRVGTEGIAGEVTLPPGLTGTFQWRARTLSLSPGRQSLRM